MNNRSGYGYDRGAAPVKEVKAEKTYITEDNYVDEAERVIQVLKNKTDRNGRPAGMVTTSKLRNLLAMSADIYNQVIGLQEDALSRDISSRISYLRVRFLYESGREPKVKELVEEANIISNLKKAEKSREGFYSV